MSDEQEDSTVEYEFVPISGLYKFRPVGEKEWDTIPYDKIPNLLRLSEEEGEKLGNAGLHSKEMRLKGYKFYVEWAPTHDHG
jgi:hypothetical protein